MKNKKAQADPFDFGANLGYYVMVIFLVVILFTFLAILARGITTNYYKSNYGTNALNVEERVFSCINYKDEITDITYSKVIDLNKMREWRNTNGFNICMGIEDKYAYKGARVIIWNEIGVRIGALETKNYIDRPDFTKEYPILIKDGAKMEVGSINISFWKV